jgi:beta-ketoacyl synthase-like protein
VTAADAGPDPAVLKAADAGPDPAVLRAAADAAGLAVTGAAQWPETAADTRPPPLPGFIDSAFHPLAAEVARRALERRPKADGPGATAIVVVTSFGDRTGAARVASAVATGGRVAPLLFFQSVPNAVAGHIAERHGLTGPVVCLSAPAAAAETAALLIEDGDADDALVVWLEIAAAPGDDQDRAAAVTVKSTSTSTSAATGVRA